MNQTLAEMAKCLLQQCNLHKSFWGEVINCAVDETGVFRDDQLKTPYISKNLDPRFSGIRPAVSHLKIFEQIFFVF